MEVEVAAKWLAHILKRPDSGFGAWRPQRGQAGMEHLWSVTDFTDLTIPSLAAYAGSIQLWADTTDIPQPSSGRNGWPFVTMCFRTGHPKISDFIVTVHSAEPLGLPPGHWPILPPDSPPHRCR